MRTDSRIEQLLAVINGIWATSPLTSSRSLRLRTYAVVPMSPHIGFVGWVDGTLPIKAAIEIQARQRLAAAGQPSSDARASRAPERAQWTVGFNDAANVRTKWMVRYSKKGGDEHKPVTYQSMFQNASAAEVRPRSLPL